ncbi:MAG: PcfB family protein [Oscillospiraceae bacterium]|nr:PcfB family protein [Oscillospiraceae bacterium]
MQTGERNGAKLDNIPIDNDKMGLFDSVARSYGVDYSNKEICGSWRRK